MANVLDIKKLTYLGSNSARLVRTFLKPVARVLLFSPADDAFYPRKSVAVSLEKGKLSVALGTVLFSKMTVRGIREYAFGEEKFPEPDDVASSLVLASNEFGIARPAVTLSIPKAWTVITTAELPSTVKEDLPAVVAYELDRITPFSADDAYYDFEIVRETAEKVTVVVAAARANAVRPYLRALTEGGFTVERLTVNLSALGTLSQYRDKARDSLVVMARATGYEGALFIDGAPVNASSGHFPEGDDAARVRVLNEGLHSLMEAARAQGRTPAITVHLREAGPGMEELFKRTCSLPVKILSANGIRFSSPPREVPYAAVGGLLQSLWPKAGSLNLFSKGARPVRTIPVALTAALLCCLAGIWFLSLVAPVRVEQQRVDELSRQIAMRKDEVRKVEAMKKENDSLAAELALITGFKQDKPMTINLLKELTTVLPKTTWLTRTRIAQTTVELEGYASSATELLPKLESSPFFTKVEFASPTFRDARMNMDRFMIKMELRGAKKNEEKPKDEQQKKEEKPKSEKK